MKKKEAHYGTDAYSQGGADSGAYGAQRLPGVTFLSSSDGGIDLRDMPSTGRQSRGTITGQFAEEQSDASLNAANLVEID